MIFALRSIVSDYAKFVKPHLCGICGQIQCLLIVSDSANNSGVTKIEKELEDFERVFKALAHRSRRHILVVLNARQGKMTAGQIAERFRCSWPTTSRHLRILEKAGLVRVHKQGREWVYTLNIMDLQRVVGNWISHFEAKEE
jgi:DNA-binding transcriptional ArsR family regulator